MTKNNKKGLIFCKLEPLKLDCPDIKIELEDIKIPDVTIKDTNKRTEFVELLGSINRLVFEAMDKKIIKEGLRNKKDNRDIKKV